MPRRMGGGTAGSLTEFSEHHRWGPWCPIPSVRRHGDQAEEPCDSAHVWPSDLDSLTERPTCAEPGGSIFVRFGSGLGSGGHTPEVEGPYRLCHRYSLNLCWLYTLNHELFGLENNPPIKCKSSSSFSDVHRAIVAWGTSEAALGRSRWKKDACPRGGHRGRCRVERTGRANPSGNAKHRLDPMGWEAGLRVGLVGRTQCTRGW